MLFLFIYLFKKVKTAFTNFTLLKNQCKSNLEYCYFYKYIVLCKKKLTYESRPIQVYSKHWKSIWHILWYLKAIFESLQWKVHHSHCSHFWSVIPNGSQHMQKWTHSALLVITETSKSICNFACPHNCPPKGNGDRIWRRNDHKENNVSTWKYQRL